jgi:hypothetical protein
VKNAGDLKIFNSVEELFDEITNTKVTVTLRIKWFYQRFKRNVRTAVRTPKWWVQRARRGYSDRDMWNADIYLAGVFAGTLQWYIDKGIGVPMSYASKDDPYGEDIDGMVSRRDEDYRNMINLFNEYHKNGHAINADWKEKFGGLLDTEVDDALQWFSKHFTELWD